MRKGHKSRQRISCIMDGSNEHAGVHSEDASFTAQRQVPPQLTYPPLQVQQREQKPRGQGRGS